MLKLIKLIVLNQFKKKGYLIREIDKFIEHEFTNPIEAIYWNGAASETLFFNVDIDKCTNIYGFSFSPKKFHPFFKTIEEYIKMNSKLQYSNSVLRKYYDVFQPKNLGEIFFDTEYQSEIFLKNNPSSLIFLPWLYRERIMRGEHGLDRSEGSQSFGPVTDRKGNLEFSRIINTFESIKNYGYNPHRNDGHPKGYFLKNKEDYRFVIQSGNHRIAALAALGWTKIPVQFRPNFPRVIDIKDIKDWPYVKNKKVDIEMAKKIFELFFHGRQFKFEQDLSLLNSDDKKVLE